MNLRTKINHCVRKMIIIFRFITIFRYYFRYLFLRLSGWPTRQIIKGFCIEKWSDLWNNQISSILFENCLRKNYAREYIIHFGVNSISSKICHWVIIILILFCYFFGTKVPTYLVLYRYAFFLLITNYLIYIILYNT